MVKSSCRVAALSSLFIVVIGARLALAQTEQSPSPASKAEAYYQFMLGRHLEGEDELEQSIAAFQKAAALDPTAAEVPAELAALYQR